MLSNKNLALRRVRGVAGVVKHTSQHYICVHATTCSGQLRRLRPSYLV